MIINFHPTEIESKKGIEVLAKINSSAAHAVVHATEKTPEEWRNIIKSDEQLILLAPVYWWSAGYVFDKWAQEVLSYGFAYTYDTNGTPEGLLSGRAFEMHMTHGTPAAYASAMRENIQKRMEQGIFGFCKATVKLSFYDMT